jgi:hypothetical protein
VIDLRSVLPVDDRLIANALGRIVAGPPTS